MLEKALSKIRVKRIKKRLAKQELAAIICAPIKQKCFVGKL